MLQKDIRSFLSVKKCSPAYALNWEKDSCLKMTSFLSPPRKVVWRSIKELAGILSPLLECFIHRLSNKHGKEHTDSWPSLFSSFPASLRFMCAQTGINLKQEFLVYSWALPEEVFAGCPVCPLRSKGPRWYSPGRIMQTLIFGKLLRKRGKDSILWTDLR